MRYFRIHDEFSDPEGDLYRWDGNVVRMQNRSGEWSDHFDFPASGETVEELMATLAGGQGYFEEETE